jgi:hypothetical protein
VALENLDFTYDTLFRHTLRFREENLEVSMIPSATDPGVTIIPNSISALKSDFRSAL